MSDEVIINQKTYHAIRLAADAVLYSPDYITRLAREHKINAVQLGRRWYVRIDSLKSYSDTQQQEQNIRKKHLRLQRKAERKINSPSRVTMFSGVNFEHQVTAAVLGVLMFGVIIGSQLMNQFPLETNLASVVNIQDERLVTTNISPDILQVKFSENNQSIFVDGSRTIGNPNLDQQWTLIQHE